eukprot:CAMPEP_0194760146 /NCGR_PEP_ID=MMETSP0323_2-20130528/13107_1 /TAXON_ID=2866 ORGANISM="Crypthecodinium cohnii, Strain Seligo" /NCGR_SAMPLE_ID=MMETSP0323_2 /ASSEMBLY_ACC=CAM_ASM_000346 /LENGTH=32 /DNA_ID= /DNA_START= /DNA_END= /DNA_ORIENTATION=
MNSAGAAVEGLKGAEAQCPSHWERQQTQLGSE